MGVNLSFGHQVAGSYSDKPNGISSALSLDLAVLKIMLRAGCLFWVPGVILIRKTRYLIQSARVENGHAQPYIIYLTSLVADTWRGIEAVSAYRGMGYKSTFNGPFQQQKARARDQGN